MKKKIIWIVLAALFCFFTFAGMAEAPASVSLLGNVTVPIPEGFQEPDMDESVDFAYGSAWKYEGALEYALSFQAQLCDVPDEQERQESMVMPPTMTGTTVEKLRWYTVNGRLATMTLLSSVENQYSPATIEAISTILLDEVILRVSLSIPVVEDSPVGGDELMDQLWDVITRITVGDSPLTTGETEQRPVVRSEKGDNLILTGESCRFVLVGDSQEVAETFGPVQWTVTGAYGDLPGGIAIAEDGLLTVDRNAVQGITYCTVEAFIENTGERVSSYISIKPNPDDIDESQAVWIDTLPELDAFFGKTYLAYDTIPEENRIPDYMMFPEELPLKMNGMLSKCTVTYISGDEALLDAFTVSSCVAFNVMELKEPGEVTFRLKAIAVSMDDHPIIHEKEYTLCVTAYEGPVMEFLSDTPEIYVSVYNRDSIESVFSSIAKRTEAGDGIALTAMMVNGESSGYNVLNNYSSGDYQVQLGFCFSSACYETDTLIHVIPYTLRGPEQVYPGQKVQYSVVRPMDYFGEKFEPVDGFTLRTEGNAGTQDNDGFLVIDPDASVGETFRIVAESPEEKITLGKTCTVAENPLKQMNYHEAGLGAYTVPVPDGSDFNESVPQGMNDEVLGLSAYNRAVRYEYTLEEKDSEGSETGDLRVNMILDNAEFEPDEEYSFTVNGWPATAVLRHWSSSEVYYYNGKFEPAWDTAGESQAPDRWTAMIKMVQDNQMLTLEITWSYVLEEQLWIPPVTMDDLMGIAKRITFNGEPLNFEERSLVPCIVAEGSPETLNAGEALQFGTDDQTLALTAEYGEIEWSVKPVQAWQPLKGVAISNNGKLTTKVNSVNDSEQEILVIAKYKNLPDVSVYKLLVLPALKKITTSISGFIFMGQEDVPVRIVPVPEAAVCGKVEWSVDHPETVEWTVDDDNLLHLKPLQPGTFTIKVSEESKKKASVKIRVSDNPVTEVRINLKKGTPVVGGKMTFAAEFSPEKPDCKDVKWSVDPYIGEFSDKGVLSISPYFAEPGKEFTVTCEALGAPEPVIATMTFTIE